LYGLTPLFAVVYERHRNGDQERWGFPEEEIIEKQK
jgi:hypothetical protein